MLRIDLSYDHGHLIVIHEDDHIVQLPATARGMQLLKELIIARKSDKPVELKIGHDGNPVQYDVDRYLKRPFWDAEAKISDWLKKHPIKKITPKVKPREMTLEDLLDE